MTDGRIKTEKKKGKFRFNFIDLMVIAFAALFLIGYFGSSDLFDSDDSTLLLTLRLSDHDRLQASSCDDLPPAGAKVTSADGVALYGILEGDYEPGDEFVTLRVKAHMVGSDPTVGDMRLYPGQSMDIRSASLLCHGAVIETITEVKANCR